MSVSGPCLWLPSPAAPPSHLAAISTPSAWNQDQTNPPRLSTERAGHTTTTTNPLLPPVSSNIVQPAEHTAPSSALAETTAPAPASAASGYELMPPPKDTADDRTVDSNSDGPRPLSRTRLDKLNRSESFPSSVSRKDTFTSSSPHDITTPDRKRKRHDDSDQHEGTAEGAMASSDDGAGSPGAEDEHSDAKVEKKKMKRFRLTHNQTRFLMSEFTRQAHPDAAHRERLSKEIPGLTPRQVQVWFQNRRAKLKRLTTNDRERMLKSRALPDGFDTTQVLRTPFDHKSTSETPVGPSSKHGERHMLTNDASQMLLTSGLQRQNEDEYVMSPLSAPSAGGNYFSSTERQDNYSTPSLANRPAMPAGLADMQRAGRAYQFSRSSSLSDAYPGLPQLPSRFSSPSTESLGNPGMPYARRPMDYGISRPPNGMVPGYDPNRSIEGSVSPDQQGSPMPYAVDGGGSQVQNYQSPMAMPPPKPFAGLGMNSPMQPHARQIPSLHSGPVSESPDYRPYSYEAQPYPMHNNTPFTQPGASNMSLPATFPPDTGHMPPSTADGRMNPPHILDPMRAKYGGQAFDYTNYI